MVKKEKTGKDHPLALLNVEPHWTINAIEPNLALDLWTHTLTHNIKDLKVIKQKASFWNLWGGSINRLFFFFFKKLLCQWNDKSDLTVLHTTEFWSLVLTYYVKSGMLFVALNGAMCSDSIQAPVGLWKLEILHLSFCTSVTIHSVLGMSIILAHLPTVPGKGRPCSW